MKFAWILIFGLVAFAAGYLVAPCEVTPLPGAPPRELSLSGYFKDAETVQLSYKLGDMPRKTATLQLAPGEGELLEKALAADLAAGEGPGRMHYTDHYEIAVAGPSGMVHYKYLATLGAARISMTDGPQDRLLASSGFATELLKLIRLHDKPR